MNRVTCATLVVLVVASKGGGDDCIARRVANRHSTSVLVNRGGSSVSAAVGDTRQFVRVGQRGSGKTLAHINGVLGRCIVQVGIHLRQLPGEFTGAGEPCLVGRHSGTCCGYKAQLTGTGDTDNILATRGSVIIGVKRTGTTICFILNTSVSVGIIGATQYIGTGVVGCCAGAGRSAGN